MFDKLTVKVAILPSFTVTSDISTVGGPSLSIIVASPLAVVLAVVPEVTVPLNTN